jgi:hypothetical protein
MYPGAPGGSLNRLFFYASPEYMFGKSFTFINIVT